MKQLENDCRQNGLSLALLYMQKAVLFSSFTDSEHNKNCVEVCTVFFWYNVYRNKTNPLYGLELCTSYSSSCHHSPPRTDNQGELANWGSPWKWPLRRCLYCTPFRIKRCSNSVGGTGIRGLVRGMPTLPQGNQELLVVRYKVGIPPDELGVGKSMECDIFPVSALTLLAGRREGHPACKNWVLVCCWWRYDWSFAQLITPVVITAFHTFSSNKTG